MWVKAIRLILLACAAGASLAAGAGCHGVMRSTHEPGLVRPARRELAEFNRAVELAAALRYEDAAQAFVAMIPRFEAARDAEYAAEAIFWAGYCHEKLGKPAIASEYYQRVLRQYPATRPVDLAAARLKLVPPRPE